MTLMTKQLWAATRALLVLTVILGVGYPLVITAVGRLMPGPAAGSIITVNGQPVGSALIGQAAPDPQWFQARPSVSDHSGQTSGGSNWGPSAAGLAQDVAAREAELRAANPQAPAGPIPADALTASASGLDPHISPAYAAWQAAPGALGHRTGPAGIIALPCLKPFRPGACRSPRCSTGPTGIAASSTG